MKIGSNCSSFKDGFSAVIRSVNRSGHRHSHYSQSEPLNIHPDNRRTASIMMPTGITISLTERKGWCCLQLYFLSESAECVNFRITAQPTVKTVQEKACSVHLVMHKGALEQNLITNSYVASVNGCKLQPFKGVCICPMFSCRLLNVD